jgi:hypothetical protein
MRNNIIAPPAPMAEDGLLPRRSSIFELRLPDCQRIGDSCKSGKKEMEIRQKVAAGAA